VQPAEVVVADRQAEVEPATSAPKQPARDRTHGRAQLRPEGVAVRAADPVIGLAVESLCFHTLERLTVRRWGVQR